MACNVLYYTQSGNATSGLICNKKGDRSIPDSTLYNNINFLHNIEVARFEPKIALTWIKYSPSEEEIERAIEELRREMVRNPTLNEVGVTTGKNPNTHAFQDSFFKVAQATISRSQPFETSLLNAELQR